jgi:hypothetical protein
MDGRRAGWDATAIPFRSPFVNPETPRRLAMKSTLICLLASVTLLAADSRGDELGKVDDYDLVPIASLHEIQGKWTSEPPGALRYRGDILEIDGKKGIFSLLTDTPPLRRDPMEIGIEIADGVLLLKTDGIQIGARKWHLAKIGKQECLVAMFGVRGAAPLRLETTVLYRQPAKDQAK